MELDKKLYAEIKEYCSLNDLKLGEFLNKLVREAFLREKYGEAPPFIKKKEPEPPVEEKKVEKTEVKKEEKVEVEEIKKEVVKPKKRNLY